MPNPSLDPAAFRKLERDGWNRLSAGYHHHWEHLTTQAVPLILTCGVKD